MISEPVIKKRGPLSDDNTVRKMLEKKRNVSDSSDDLSPKKKAAKTIESNGSADIIANGTSASEDTADGEEAAERCKVGQTSSDETHKGEASNETDSVTNKTGEYSEYTQLLQEVGTLGQLTADLTRVEADAGRSLDDVLGHIYCTAINTLGLGEARKVVEALEVAIQKCLIPVAVDIKRELILLRLRLSALDSVKNRGSPAKVPTTGVKASSVPQASCSEPMTLDMPQAGSSTGEEPGSPGSLGAFHDGEALDFKDIGKKLWTTKTLRSGDEESNDEGNNSDGGSSNDEGDNSNDESTSKDDERMKSDKDSAATPSSSSSSSIKYVIQKFAP